MFLRFLHSLEHKEAFLELAHLAANADGYVSRSERGSLRSYMDEMNMLGAVPLFPKRRELAEIIGDLKDEQVKNIFFVEILMLIFSDGDYNDEEKQIVNRMAELFGFSDETCEKFKEWVVRMDRLKIEGVGLILDPR